MEALKKMLKEKWAARDVHCRQYHSQGCCWYGKDAGWAHLQFDTQGFYNLLQMGQRALQEEFISSVGNPKEFLGKLSPQVAQDLRSAMALPTVEERLAVWEEVKTEYQIQKKAQGKAFAKEQLDKLVEFGFSRRDAVAIMRAAGPGRVMEAVNWAKYALSVIPSTDALDCLLYGAGGTNGFGKYRMEGALRAFGLEPPEAHSSTGFFRILAGAKEALLAGLPEREPVREA